MNQISDLLDAVSRQSFRLPENEAQRIFHGRGGAWPGLEHVLLDWIPPTLLITLYAEESLTDLLELAQVLKAAVPACRNVVVQRRYLRQGPVEVLIGELDEHPVAEEAGLRYQMSLGNNRNTGLFLDMRNGRHWLRERAQGKRVLNLFAYTCGFSIAAVDGGAECVLNVDTSSPALAIGRQNHVLNRQSTADVRFERLEVFRSFGRFAKLGPFDVLVCDPPTFQKGSVDIKRDYPKIIRRLDRFMAPESDLLMCLNAPHLGSGFLLEAMAADAPDYDFVERVPLPEAFVEPTGGGMKALHFRRIAPA